MQMPSSTIKVPFYGKWSLSVIGKNAEFQQRVVIEGSLASDGVIGGVVGQHVAAIDGKQWWAFVESSSDGASWTASRLLRVPGVLSPEGLIVTLFSDDVVPGGSDGDFDDLIVQLVYLDPEVNPPGPPPYSFTLPPSAFRPSLPTRGTGCGCRCAPICSCRAKRPARKRGGC
jgi:hypothetical protein